MDTAVDKALIVLGSLEVVKSGRTLAEISESVNMPKATVHRLLATLQRHGYVQQSANGRYALGMRLVSLGLFAATNSDLLSAGAPILDRLVLQCGETVHLGVLHGESLLYIDRREPEDAAVRLATLPSPLTSLHASACGKVLLAFGPPSLFDTVVRQGLVKNTKHTVTDPDDLRRQLEQIRAQGYAINNQERHEGVVAVGVPVRRMDGKVVAALSAAGPIQRVDEQKVADMCALLQKAADELALTVR